MKKVYSVKKPFTERKFDMIKEDAKVLAGRLKTFYRSISALPNVSDYLDSYDVDAIQRTIEALEDVSLGVVLQHE